MTYREEILSELYAVNDLMKEVPLAEDIADQLMLQKNAGVCIRQFALLVTPAIARNTFNAFLRCESRQPGSNGRHGHHFQILTSHMMIALSPISHNV